MGRPTKKRRFSRIVVNQTNFQWRFDGKLHVLAESDTSSRGQRLIVDWGWIDWCEVDFDPKDVRGPLTVTPSFVRSAIEYALNAGWTPDEYGPDLAIDFSNDIFNGGHETSEQ